MKSVYFTYRTTMEPYGGVNSFNRAIRRAMERRPEYGWRAADSLEEADLLFMSAASLGPDARGRDRPLACWRLRNLLAKRSLNDPRGFLPAQQLALPMVHRLDGLTSRYGRKRGGATYDALQGSLNKLAAATVFQSEFCRQSFRGGDRRPEDSVILNGVDGDLFPWKARPKPVGPIRIVASSWSSNPLKGHEGLALLSTLSEVSVAYVGRWPEGIDPRLVRRIPAVRQGELLSHFHEADAFAHLAAYDPSPNVVLEALATGLPILYLESGGTPELCGGGAYGVAVSDASRNALDAGVRTLRTRLPALREQVATARAAFLIEGTLRKYANVFDHVLAAYRK